MNTGVLAMITIRPPLYCVLWMLLFSVISHFGCCFAEARPESIRVVMDNNYPPYVFYDSEGRLQGILIDRWQLWEKKTGITVDIHAIDWGKALSGMKAGEFDVIDTVFETEERSLWLDFSRPYADIEVPIFFDKDISGITDAASLKGFPVATKTGDAAIELLTRNGVDNLILFNSYEAVILAAKEHRVSVFVIDAPPAHYFLYKFGISDRFKQSAPLNIGQFHQAVKKGNLGLLKIIEDGFRKISADEMKHIETRWYGSAVHDIRLPRYLLIAAASLGLLIMILFIWNRILRKTIAARTAALNISIKELQTLSMRQDAILSAVPDIVMEVDAKRIYTWANSAGVAFFGEDVVGREAAFYFKGEQHIHKEVQPLFEETADVLYVESWQRRKDGEIRLLAWWCRKLEDDHGNITGEISSARDITDYKRAEEERELNAQRMHALLQLNQMTESTPHEITNFALEEAVRLTQSTIGYLAFLNEDESVLTMHSWSKSAMAECAIADKPIEYPVESTGLWGEAVRQRQPVMTNDYSSADSLKKGYPEGHVVIRRHMNTPVFAGSRIVLVAGVGNKTDQYNSFDVQQLTLLMEGMWRLIEHRRAEKALWESEKKLRLITENTADVISTLDMDLRFTYISPTIVRLRGFTVEEAMEQTLEQVLTPESMQIAISVFSEEMLLEASGTADPDRTRIMELEEYKKDGTIIWIESSFSFLRDNDKKPVGILSVSRDITERRKAAEEKIKLEAQLQQAQKMQAIGTLAGGVAHDFNNLLMGIQGRTSLISLDMETSHPHWEHIHAIDQYIQSATNLTKQLLGFARGGQYEVRPIDINELVLSSSAMFGRTKKEIRIHANCQQASLVVEADRGQIEQVLLNMYLNAWQAMPPGGSGGEIYLETKTVSLDKAFCHPHQVEPGIYVLISITDTGIGMDEVTCLRIFDPFFTTKEKSRGTGMGLASAYGIIRNHGGIITVYSEIGHGSTFKIYLPVSDKEAHHNDMPMENDPIKGSGTILLVDDEEMIVDVGQAMLKSLGYHVIAARGGQEALEAMANTGNIIDLVILDLIMPGMDGATTFDRIQKIQPGMPVLLSSGYAINSQADEIMRRGCSGFIQKPYNIQELSSKVRLVLGERKI